MENGISQPLVHHPLRSFYGPFLSLITLPAESVITDTLCICLCNECRAVLYAQNEQFFFLLWELMLMLQRAKFTRCPEGTTSKSQQRLQWQSLPGASFVWPWTCPWSKQSLLCWELLMATMIALDGLLMQITLYVGEVLISISKTWIVICAWSCNITMLLMFSRSLIEYL